jgi:hypothetical protein
MNSPPKPRRKAAFVLAYSVIHDGFTFGNNNEVKINCAKCSTNQKLSILKGMNAAIKELIDYGWKYINNEKVKGPVCQQCQGKDRTKKRTL